MGLESGLTWSVIYDFCFRYCVESSGGHHVVADAFTKVSDLNPDLLEEGIAGPSPKYHNYFRVYSC